MSGAAMQKVPLSLPSPFLLGHVLSSRVSVPGLKTNSTQLALSNITEERGVIVASDPWKEPSRLEAGGINEHSSCPALSVPDPKPFM